MAGKKRDIGTYEHQDKERINNPPVGLVTPETDQDAGKKTYAYDPHLDPQLVWAGKAEHTSFEVPTVSLHVHERIDPRTIVEAVRKQNGPQVQPSLFETPGENPPLRQAIEFYKHKHGWSNRLIAGDSLLVMNSLLEKEGLAGQVQMIYIDPPYGIKYGSNFQPFVNKRDVRDGKDEDLTQEPEMIRAFRDTWELGIHSYLTYLRDRLLLARELLHESGSCFVQIGDENVHHVLELMEEIFNSSNYCGIIQIQKTSGQTSLKLAAVCDFILWYAKSVKNVKYRQLFIEKPAIKSEKEVGICVEKDNGELVGLKRRQLAGIDPIPKGRILRLRDTTSETGSEKSRFPFDFEGIKYVPSGKRGWSTTEKGLNKLVVAKRLFGAGKSLRWKFYHDEFPYEILTELWSDVAPTGFAKDNIYVVQTATEFVQRCVLMTTDPGDLVLDPTCGSGTTAFVAEQWGRRWITCDTSRVALTLAKQRIMTAAFDYYELAHSNEGVGSGFNYMTVPHITLKSIANNPDIKEGMSRAKIDAAIARHAPQETLYDQPLVDKKKVRVTGPFTVEAVPAPVVKALHEIKPDGDQPADTSIARDGETLRQAEWRDELLQTGIRAKGKQKMEFSRVEPLSGTTWLHADAAVKQDESQRVVVSFGPEHAPLEQRQVELAIEEARNLVPQPKIFVFAAFEFDPEAAKDIDETRWPSVTLLKAQMNADLLTEDLKKKRASNESFWLMGQPDVKLTKIKKGDDKGKFQVKVLGFDYYNTRTGNIDSGGPSNIALWMLDTDYDGRSLYPRQVFFPMAGDKEGWARLAKNLKAEIDEDLIEAYRGTESLPFEAGDYRRIAVKIFDDRGIESLKIVGLD